MERYLKYLKRWYKSMSVCVYRHGNTCSHTYMTTKLRVCSYTPDVHQMLIVIISEYRKWVIFSFFPAMSIYYFHSLKQIILG